MNCFKFKSGDLIVCVGDKSVRRFVAYDSLQSHVVYFQFINDDEPDRTYNGWAFNYRLATDDEIAKAIARRILK